MYIIAHPFFTDSKRYKKCNASHNHLKLSAKRKKRCLWFKMSSKRTKSLNIDETNLDLSSESPAPLLSPPIDDTNLSTKPTIIVDTACTLSHCQIKNDLIAISPQSPSCDISPDTNELQSDELPSLTYTNHILEQNYTLAAHNKSFGWRFDNLKLVREKLCALARNNQKTSTTLESD